MKRELLICDVCEHVMPPTGNGGFVAAIAPILRAPDPRVGHTTIEDAAPVERERSDAELRADIERMPFKLHSCSETCRDVALRVVEAFGGKLVTVSL